MTVFLHSSMPVTAQLNYTDWSQQPAIHNLKNDYTKESAVIIEDSRTHEYRKDEKNDMWIYVYNRRVIKVNDDKGVEQYNKIYVYIPADAEVLLIKARTILPDGKIVDLPASKIFDEEDEGRKYKKFAPEAIEKGSEIEYFVNFKKEIATFGLEIFQSAQTPIAKASFTLIVPEYLVFSVKGYNGFTVSPETISDGKRINVATQENIEAIEEEKYSTATPYNANVQYKLTYNLDKDKNVKMYTWNELAKNVYRNYNTFSESDMKAVNSLIRQMKLKESDGEEAKIVAVEDYLKTNINTNEHSLGEGADKIDQIIKTKVAGKFGFTRLLLCTLEKLGISNEIVFPSKRDELAIDENFENYRLLDDIILYFPGTGKFLDPGNESYRYPFVEPYFAGTKGIFLKGTSIGDFKTALPSFDTIPTYPYEKNGNNLEVTLSFNEGLDSLIINSKQILMGYSASVYRPAYTFLPKDKQDEFTRDVVKAVGNSENISDMKVENGGMTDGSKDLPLNIIARLSTTELTERAGNNILLKIGESIGPQEQMYQEKKRKLPVVIQYPHMLDRTIKLIIPQGYKIKNPDDLNMHVTDSRESMGFVSTYTQDKNELTINIHEYYKEIYYPVSYFEEFRKVINASADFNKVVLILEKK